MDEKKSFFELLDSKSALIVGAVGGVLVLGTLGFVVLGSMAWKGNLSLGNGSGSGLVVDNNNQQVAGEEIIGPPPVVPKSDRPKVELFVMSYCPYGLQMEKAYLPAWELLKNKADIDVKFVSYAMHGKEEVDENTRQYCIQKEDNAKYIAYLKCFATTSDAQSCLSQSGVNQSKVNSCMSATDKKFGITAKYNDQASWLSGRYPIYPIHEDLNTKYGVQGSPTLVINGAQADVGRTPEAIKQAICAAFNNAPAECGQKLSAASYNPGFGATLGTAGGAATAAECGT